MGSDGCVLVRGIVTGYEIQMNLVCVICLYKYKIDYVVYIGSSVLAGIGTLLGLDVDIIY